MPDPAATAPSSAGVTITTAPQAQPAQTNIIRPDTRPPKRNPKLTHDEMQAVIIGGGSILHNGEVISTLHELPDAADLARGDVEKEAAAREAIDTQIAVLTHQRSKLTSTTDGSEKSKDLTGKPKV